MLYLQYQIYIALLKEKQIRGAANLTAQGFDRMGLPSSVHGMC